MTDLFDISITKYNALLRALNKDDSWIKILNVIHRQYPHINISINSDIRDYESPAQKFLNEFRSRCWPLEFLVDKLIQCELYEAAALFYSEPMSIRKQPTEAEDVKDNELSIFLNSTFILEFDVFGIPRPTFQWYKNDKPLNDQTEAKLIYEQFRPELEGTYYCTALQIIDGISRNTELQSDFVIVKAFSEKCVIYDRPLPYVYKINGESVKLQIFAAGYPTPQFQWKYENKILENFTENTLLIERCNLSNTGTYECEVFNTAGNEIIKIHLTVVDFASIDSEPVSMKIALLIGNKDYEHHSSLASPINDVRKLQNTLLKKGFHVITKINLSLREMIDAVKILCDGTQEGAYVLIYFGGHGFHKTDKYLMPVDTPKGGEYCLSHCISESQILHDVLKVKPKLLLLMLDMCLKLPDKDANPNIFTEITKTVCDYQPDYNLLISYSTTMGLASFECNDKNFYIDSLIKNMEIKPKLPVLQIIYETNRSVQLEFENLMSKTKERLEETDNDDDRIKLEEKLKYMEVRKQIPSMFSNIVKGFDLDAPVIVAGSNTPYQINIK